MKHKRCEPDKTEIKERRRWKQRSEGILLKNTFVGDRNRWKKRFGKKNPALCLEFTAQRLKKRILLKIPINSLNLKVRHK